SLRDKLRRATGRADVAVNGAAAATVAGAAAQSTEVGAGAAKDASQPAEPGAAMTEEERVAARARLSTLLAELATLQGEQPLVLPSVDAQAVGTVVSDWTGIPVGRMVKDEIAAVLKLSDTLAKRVIGQD